MSREDASTKSLTFIERISTQRECIAYIANKEETGWCECGRKKDWHDENEISALTDDVPWDPNIHTVVSACSSFGCINFEGFGTNVEKNSAMYVRMEHQTKPEDVWTLMVTHWKLPRPKMLISVTGGENEKLSNFTRHGDSFKRSLIDVATKTGAWIVTGGTNAGAAKLVGEAVRDYGMRAGAEDSNIVCIGFATWGVIKNRAALESGGDHRFPAVYHREGVEYAPGLSPLDHNHTYFILVDNGTVNRFGAEVDLRVAMESNVSGQKIKFGPRSEGEAHILVLLVVGGDVNTLETVLHALHEKTPVVVVGSSGGAADFIKEATEMIKSKESQSDFEDKMAHYAQNYFEIRDDDGGKLRQALDWIREIVNEPCCELVKVSEFNVKDDLNLDKTIMRAVIGAVEGELALELLLAWNRIDIARLDDLKEFLHKRSTVKILRNLLYPALVEDRVEFVNFFLENGAKIVYLTPEELARLYNAFLSKTQESDNDACRMLRTMIKQMLKKGDPSPQLDVLPAVGHVLDYLMGDEYKFYDSYEKLAKGGILRYNPYSDLFLWSLLLNRMDMATLFWRKGEDHIGGALIGSVLCRALHDKANSEDYVYLALDMRDHASRFEQLGIDMLNNCYQRDKDVTHKLLVRELRSWQHRTLLSIAGTEERKNFIGQPACGTKLNNIWRGKITANTSMFKILSALFLPPLIWTIRFTNDANDNADIVDEKPNGNNKVEPTNESFPEVESTNEQPPSFQATNEQSTKVEVTNENSVVAVSTASKQSSRKRHVCGALIFFYTSPMIKFCFDVISQLAYLALFSYFVVVDLQPMNNDSHRASPANTELAVWAWMLTVFMEQIRKILVQEPKSLRLKLKYFFESHWARFDALMFSMFITSIILRCVLKGEDFMWARILYCVTLSLVYIRFMYFFNVHSLIGPKVITIRLMMTDLLLFVSVWVIFLLPYGVMLEALRLPGYDNSWARLKRIVYYPYWQMYNVIDSNVQSGVFDACSNATDPDNIDAECQQSNGVIMFICAVYSLLTAILLLNLLIAMFNSTFTKVQEDSWGLWSYQKYGLVYDYFERPTLAPPLIIFGHIWRCAKYVFRKRGGELPCGHDFLYVIDWNETSFSVSYQEYFQLTAFEQSSMEMVMLEEEKKQDHTLDSSSSSDAVVELRKQLNDNQKHLQSQEQQLNRVEQQLSLIVNMLKSTVGSPSNKQS